LVTTPLPISTNSSHVNINPFAINHTHENL
jgi:hypothetical protein